MELQLDKILCPTLGHYPSTKSCKYTWFFPTGLKNYNTRQNRFKIDKIKKYLKYEKICCIKIKRHVIKPTCVKNLLHDLHGQFS